MDEEALNNSVRKFLKKVGVTSQQEIEHSLRRAIEQGDLTDGTTVPVKMTLECPEIGLTHTIDDELKT